MDLSLRELQRLAALGDEEALAELDLRARRLGSTGASFRAPRLVGELVKVKVTEASATTVIGELLLEGVEAGV